MSIKRDKNTGRFVKGNKSGKIFKKGDKLSEETKGKMKGRIPWNKGKGLSTSILVDEGFDIKSINKDPRSKGCVTPGGYLKYKIKGKAYFGHRLVWELKKGKIPRGHDIHHKDGNKRNNNINNLEVIKHGMHSRLSHQEVRRKL